MLIGEYSYNIDAKGRLNFPSKLREDLGDIFILSKSLTDSCLNAYSLEQWQKLVEKIEALPISKSRNIKRQLFSSACEVQTDKQGRILISQNLREYAGLNKEVMIIGVSNNCEVWDKSRWEEECSKIDTDSLADALEELGI